MVWCGVVWCGVVWGGVGWGSVPEAFWEGVVGEGGLEGLFRGDFAGLSCSVLVALVWKETGDGVSCGGFHVEGGVRKLFNAQQCW